MSFLHRLGQMVSNPVGSFEGGLKKEGAGLDQLDKANKSGDALTQRIINASNIPGDITSGRLSRGLSDLSSSSNSGPAAPPTDYWSQSLGGPNSTYSTMTGIDPNKLLNYFQQTQKGFNVNDPNQVKTALTAAINAGWIQPSFLAGQNQGNDPLVQQALFQNTIKPYLDQISGAESDALTKTEGIQQGIQQQYGADESANVKALLGNLNASVDKQGSQDLNYAKQAALTGPGITEILDALRAQYINELNNTTTGTGTTASAKLPAPSTLTAVNAALAAG